MWGGGGRGWVENFRKLNEVIFEQSPLQQQKKFRFETSNRGLNRCEWERPGGNPIKEIYSERDISHVFPSYFIL